MRSGPLYKIMFPGSNTISEVQVDEIIHWYTDIVETAFQDGLESLLKACDDVGTPHGSCGWAVIEGTRG
jgi:hypothetical protein